VRPLSQDELNAGEISTISFPESDQIQILNPATNQSKMFEFEKVFQPNSTQGFLFFIFLLIDLKTDFLSLLFLLRNTSFSGGF
jgi:hypothetical protein